MNLLRVHLQPKLCALGRRPRKRPLPIHNHDFIDAEFDFELDGGEDALVGGFERVGADGRGEAGRHYDAVGGVEGEEVGYGVGGEDFGVGVEEGGYLVCGGGHWGRQMPLEGVILGTDLWKI